MALQLYLPDKIFARYQANYGVMNEERTTLASNDPAQSTNLETKKGNGIFNMDEILGTTHRTSVLAYVARLGFVYFERPSHNLIHVFKIVSIDL